MIQLILNRREMTTQAPPGTVLLDLLRGEFGLDGTKEGCREGDCGACTVLVGTRVPGGVHYRTAASCLLPVGALHGAHVVTIEGLNGDGLSPVQQTLVDVGATQCGFCTPGIVVALTGFLLGSKSLSLDDACAAIEGNICRCTGYTSIRRAAERLVADIDSGGTDASGTDTGDTDAGVDPGDRLSRLVEAGQVPAYLLDIPRRLDAIGPTPPARLEGDAAIPVAGGTDLFVQRADALRDGPLRFVGDAPDLRGIARRKGRIVIGAATTTEELKESAILRDAFPVWDRAMRLISSTLIRNRASLGGNIVNASPIGDLAILLLALDATLEIQGPGGPRTIPLDSFYSGYKTFDLNAGELVAEVILPLPPTGSVLHFEKVSRREFLDIASVNTACLLRVEDGTIVSARLSAGGVAPVPLFLAESSLWLAGRPLSCDTVNVLLDRVDAEVAPIDDVRGSADYKRRLLGRLIIAHFTVCFPDRDWKGVLP